MRARACVCVCVCVCVWVWVLLEDRPEVDVDLLVALNLLQVVGVDDLSLTQSLFLNGSIGFGPRAARYRTFWKSDNRNRERIHTV